MSIKLKVTQPGTLLPFLFEQLHDTKKTRVRQMLKYKCVSVSGRVTTQFDCPLLAGDEVLVNTAKTGASAKSDTEPPPLGIKILHEDDDLVVITKPSGLLSIATDKILGETALAAVSKYLKSKTGQKKQRVRYQKSCFIVHRLDRDVSGVMVFAKNEIAKLYLQDHWDTFTKEYEAVVEGTPTKPSSKCVSYLSENKILQMESGPERPGARKAETFYEVLHAGRNYALLALRITTGRKHQIRVHMAELGCPVAGDRTYGAQTNPLKRIALHACRIQIKHPTNGKPLEFSAQTPSSFKQIVIA